MVKEIKLNRINGEIDDLISQLHVQTYSTVDMFWYDGNNMIFEIQHYNEQITVGRYFNSYFHFYDLEIVKKYIKTKYNCGNYTFNK